MERHWYTSYPTAIECGKIAANSTRHLLRAVAAVSLCLLAPFSSANGLLPLDQDCVVSILNRTVQAEVDGTFELFQVSPSIFGVGARL